jgi:hypothetical protein
MRASFRSLAIICIPALAIASKGGAQVKLEFTPLVGSYVPTAALIPAGTLPGFDAARVRQKAGVAFSGRVTAWVTDRLAIEGSAEYSGSGATQTAYVSAGYPCPWCYVVGTSNSRSHVSIVSVRLLRVVGGHLSSTALYILGGPAFVSYGDQDFNPCPYPSCGFKVVGMTRQGPGAVVGIGARFKVPRTNLALRADLEDCLYGARFSGESGPSPGGPLSWSRSQTQNDFLLSLGLSAHPNESPSAR